MAFDPETTPTTSQLFDEMHTALGLPLAGTIGSSANPLKVDVLRGLQRFAEVWKTFWTQGDYPQYDTPLTIQDLAKESTVKKIFNRLEKQTRDELHHVMSFVFAAKFLPDLTDDPAFCTEMARVREVDKQRDLKTENADDDIRLPYKMANGINVISSTSWNLRLGILLLARDRYKTRLKTDEWSEACLSIPNHLRSTALTHSGIFENLFRKCNPNVADPHHMPFGDLPLINKDCFTLAGNLQKLRVSFAQNVVQTVTQDLLCNNEVLERMREDGRVGCPGMVLIPFVERRNQDLASKVLYPLADRILTLPES